MKKVCFTLIASLLISLLLTGCNNDAPESTSERLSQSHPDSSTASSSSVPNSYGNVDHSDAAPNIAIPGLSYEMPFAWTKTDESKGEYGTSHEYTLAGELNTTITISFVTAKINGEPISIDTELEEYAVSAKEEVDENSVVTDYSYELSTFQEYPCIYIRRAMDINTDYSVTDADHGVLKNINHYLLAFVANEGLYQVILGTPNEIGGYMDDFNLIAESLVVSPI